MKVKLRHGGPGPHKNGTSQLVHAGPNGDALTALDSVGAAEAFMRSRYPHIAVDFTGGDIRAIAPCVAEFDRLAQEYPGAAARLESIRMLSASEMAAGLSSAMARVSHDGKEMLLNRDYFADAAKLQGLLTGDVARRFAPPGCAKPEYVMTHEFAHLVKTDLSQVDNMTSGGVYAQHFDMGLVGRDFTRWFDAQAGKTRLAGQVSDYAKRNREEAFAEAFASLRYTEPSQQAALTKATGVVLHILGDARQWRPLAESEQTSSAMLPKSLLPLLIEIQRGLRLVLRRLS